MKKKLVGLVLAKYYSRRLPRKNRLDFYGQPMFLVNVRKLLKLFDEVYVTSDSHEMLKQAEEAGAKPIWRDETLCLDSTPNIPVYQYSLSHMGEDVDGIVAVQANSPNVSEKLIITAKGLLELGYKEVMTCHPLQHDKKYHNQSSNIYGSIWALETEHLKRYQNAFHPNPEVLLVDTSEDVHYQEDYEIALKNHVS